jgi:hypothetical protein
VGGTSRMTGDCHVRICESLRVKFPGATRPAAVKSRGGERRIKKFRERPEQVSVRKTSESKPFDDASLRPSTVETRSTSIFWDKSVGSLMTGRTAVGV